MSDEAQNSLPARPTAAAGLERFQVARRTLFLDRLMTFVINAGGLVVILAVFGIFFFIFAKTLPLFGRAEVREKAVWQVPAAAPGTLLGTDEANALPFLYSGGREITFLRAGPDGKAKVEATALPLPDDFEVSGRRYDAANQRLLLGAADGRLTTIDLGYDVTYDADGAARVAATPKLAEIYQAGGDGRVVDLAKGSAAAAEVFAAIRESADGRRRAEIIPITRKAGLLGRGKAEPGEPIDLTAALKGRPERVLVAGDAQSILVETDPGEVCYFFMQGGQAGLRQRFTPFPEDGARIASIDFLLGDVSLVITSESGRVKVFSLFIPEGGDTRLFGETRAFPDLGAAPAHFAAGRRNKSFLLVAGSEAMLGYSTTTDTRWRHDLGFAPVAAALDAKGEHALFLDPAGRLHVHEIHDPHPQAGWKAFFGRIWYEGYAKPAHEWQSSGGTDDAEAKLSMVPLLIGSLKGTFYALIFAVPVALLAAVYTAQVLHPRAKRVVKPVMEIMASLPSVVLGFLAALWLAPMLEPRIPALLGALGAIPLAVAATGLAWSFMPYQLRCRVRPGDEFLWLVPVVVAAAAAGWMAGPWIERMFFVATMPDGSQIADFRLWWPQKSGTSFDARNCVVVGFMMGFAVIPIIFTIAEDALAGVPPSLTAAAEALGASRWQVIRTVVLPVAAAGMFSALMVGFGRAVGETMILVMATGNTPIMDPDGHLVLRDFFNNVRRWVTGGQDAFPLAQHWQPFSGMRTLSANLAVELPEAPENSTHYRALFLGALLLFLMTFALNTVAEVLRQRLREKYKLV
jgi:phosphate transport system permease protein